MDPGLAVEYRRLGDASVTEAFAFVLDGLLRERGWLKRFAGVAQPREVLRFNQMLVEYYDKRGWVNGVVPESKLKELEII